MPNPRIPTVNVSPELIRPGDVIRPTDLGRNVRLVAAMPAYQPQGETFWMVPLEQTGWELVIQAGGKVPVERRPQPPLTLTPEELDEKAEDYRPSRYA